MKATKQPLSFPSSDHPFNGITQSRNDHVFHSTKPFERTTFVSKEEVNNMNKNPDKSVKKYFYPFDENTSTFEKDGSSHTAETTNNNPSRSTTTDKNHVHKDIKPIQKKTEGECIGFSALPDQLHKRAVKRGFDFSFMVVGQSGLGKTTFLRSLFPRAKWESNNTEQAPKTVQLEQKQMEVEERGVKLRLTVIDTPGFGTSLDSSKDVKLVENHLKEQLGEYLKAEMGTRRQGMQDHRIHCCLYFINPSSRSLKALDLWAIRSIQDKVNLVPVIAKADTLTPSELKDAKNMIRKEIAEHGLKVYRLPDIDDDDDDEYIARDKELKSHYPFSIACSDKVVEVAGKRIAGRVYPWGVVEVENKKHSDFKLLRYFLLNSHMHDLIETTKEVHYENYRATNLNKMIRMSGEQNESEIDVLLIEKEKKLLEMQKKLEEMKLQMGQQNQTNNNLKETKQTHKTTQPMSNKANTIDLASSQSRGHQGISEGDIKVPKKMPRNVANSSNNIFISGMNNIDHHQPNYPYNSINNIHR